ncbi:hypothetical protein SB49_15740 [Sediminicola sp. YIK13]|uniref:hypothetical protein n=1 Tax=Sediminicola sp. YIK13 TaxID=1453352 RepID=UPI0007203C54|nr:hypothetical protein [Sediminicola sp. YIK13]ALM09079.1 hypothetical protein SB49_15740 [Sediminicola sp. YIK13]
MKKKLFILPLAIIAFIIIDTLILDTVQGKNVDNEQIAMVLEDQCECTVITKGLNGNGVSFPDAVYGDFHNFSLRNCKIANFEEYIAELNNSLENSIPNFHEADLVKLSFEIAPDEVRIVSIRNSRLKLER